MNKTIKTAFVGNPNCGKSTIFNALTGARQTIGNFPGVTVERYEGQTKHQGYDITFVDLPGIYSLSTFSDEEQVAVEYLKKENPDVIVNIVDAAALERNLYLTLLLLELNLPMFVVLNMTDVAKRRGIEIDIEALSRELNRFQSDYSETNSINRPISEGIREQDRQNLSADSIKIPVLAAVGNRGIGLHDILDTIVKTAVRNNSTIESDKINEISEDSKTDSENSNSTLFESVFKRSNREENSTEKCPACSKGGCCENCRSSLAWQTAEDLARYKKINRICMHAVRSSVSLEPNLSDRIDGILTNQYWGIPLFFLAMYIVFQLTFTIGQYPMDCIEAGFEILGNWINATWPEAWPEVLRSLVVNGLIGGVGGVLVFLPNILLLFLAICILEDSGYLARAALLCDRWMYKIGLHGRSIVPMLIGFGCTVPAIMATKMLSNRRERLTTMFILPLFSCGARFPIYALLIPAFFPLQWRGPILWLVYFVGILLAVLTAKILSCFYKKEEEAPFIIELPPYHLPTARTVGIRTLEKGWQYVKKAGTVILGISIILWFLTNCPDLTPAKKQFFEQERSSLAKNEKNEYILKQKFMELDKEEARIRLSESYAGRLGHFLEPVLRPMGFDWKIGTALVGAVAAKEVFIAQMSIVCTSDNTQLIDEKPTDASGSEEEHSGLTDILARSYTPLNGICLLLFCLISSPCMATFAIMAKESGSWRWAFAQWTALTLLAWILTTAVFQLGNCLNR